MKPSNNSVQDKNIDIIINVPRNHSFYDSVFKSSATKSLFS
jgi:hypothetical protein